MNPSLVKQYQEEGYTVVRGLIPPNETRPVRTRLMDLLNDTQDWPLTHFQILNPDKHRSKNGGIVPFGVQLPAKQEALFRNIADHPNLISAMEALLGGPVKRFTDQALIKSPGIGGQSFYHQDSYYWRLKPELGCNAWIALDEVGREASALAIMPGTHKTWTLIEHESYFDEPSFHNAATNQAFSRWRIPLEQIDFSREVLLPMQPGDAAFFTNFTWHRAEPNNSVACKCAYAIAYQRVEEG